MIEKKRFFLLLAFDDAAGVFVTEFPFKVRKIALFGADRSGRK